MMTVNLQYQIYGRLMCVITEMLVKPVSMCFSCMFVSAGSRIRL